MLRLERPKAVRCPFNPAHVMTSDRLQRHIMKCMLNYPNHYTCPYFAEHKFLEKDQYEGHLKTCPLKMRIDPQPIKTLPQGPKPVSAVDVSSLPNGNDDDDW